MFNQNFGNYPKNHFRGPFFTATHGRNTMLARADEGGRTTVRNARLARRFRAVSYKLAISLEVACCMHCSAAAST